MHSAKWNRASFWLSEIGGGALPPPNSLQVFSAATNAGPLKGMPSTVKVELPSDCLIVMPSPPGPLVGSERSGTPGAGMPSEGGSWELDDGVGLVLEPPQAAIA